MIRVLIVDDHWIVRSGIASMLGSVDDVLVIADVGSGEEAVAVTRKHRPHVILMDVYMPGMGGVEATRKIIEYDPTARIIILTMTANEPLPEVLLEIGVRGFITKDAPPRELIKAIMMVSGGQSYLSPQIAQRMALKPRGSVSDSPFSSLSVREMQIAMMVVRCQKVASISRNLALSPKTVNGYRYRIFDKLNVSSDLELALMAMRYGIYEQFLAPGGAPNKTDSARTFP